MQFKAILLALCHCVPVFGGGGLEASVTFSYNEAQRRLTDRCRCYSKDYFQECVHHVMSLYVESDIDLRAQSYHH